MRSWKQWKRLIFDTWTGTRAIGVWRSGVGLEGIGCFWRMKVQKTLRVKEVI